MPISNMNGTYQRTGTLWELYDHSTDIIKSGICFATIPSQTAFLAERPTQKRVLAHD